MRVSFGGYYSACRSPVGLGMLCECFSVKAPRTEACVWCPLSPTPCARR